MSLDVESNLPRRGPCAAAAPGGDSPALGHRAARALLNIHGVGTEGSASPRLPVLGREKKSICYLFLKYIDLGNFFFQADPHAERRPAFNYVF